MKTEDFFKKNREIFTETEGMSEGADAQFERLLKAEFHTAKPNTNSFQKWSIAASIALLISFGFWFSMNSDENNTLQKSLLSDMSADSAGKRLEGVYTFNDEYKKEDSRILDRLITMVLTDENANVQIASIDALLQFPENKKVRNALVKALENETKPIVQIKLIKAIQILRDNRAQESLEKIIKNEQTFPIVKNNATMAMATLKNK